MSRNTSVPFDELRAREAELSARGEEYALATVVWRQAPSSGQTGSRAIITADGQLFGWIGGACAEPVVIAQAQRVIASGEPTLLLLGQPDQFGSAVPEGMTRVPISCQSEGALQARIAIEHERVDAAERVESARAHKARVEGEAEDQIDRRQAAQSGDRGARRRPRGRWARS